LQLPRSFVGKADQWGAPAAANLAGYVNDAVCRETMNCVAIRAAK
jgi:hypothetical protein